MVSREAVEAILVSFSLALFVFYHLWLFLLRGKGSKVEEANLHDHFQAGKLARSIWAEACANDEKDAILGVQQSRNAMSACTYLATISVALATAGLTIIFDENKTARIHQLAVNDPIMRHLPGGPLVPPVAILGAALGSLYASFICFAQSVRLYVHVGFYVRACTSSFNPGTLTVAGAKRVTIFAGLAFSVGLRLFYFFIPLVMWSIGVTSLLVCSIVMTGIIAFMDHFDMPTIEEQQVTAQVLQRISLLPPASPAGPNTQQALRLTAQTAGSGATSPYQPCQPTLEEQGSSHPAPSVLLSPRASQQGAVPQSQQPSRRPSAAQDLRDIYVASMV